MLSFGAGGTVIRKFFAALFILFSVCGSANLVFALGRSDRSLSDADRLIEDGRLNQALKYLEAYAADNPGDFDKVQKRVNRIFKLRAEYKNLAEELIRTIQEEPLNDQKKLALISKLENYEKEPTPAEQAFIRETKYAAQFTYYRAMFDIIMADGVKLNEQSQFAAAVKRLSEGFVLYKKEFYEDFAGTELLDKVDSFLGSLDRAVSDYTDMQSELDSVFKKFNGALSAFDVRASLEAYEEVEAVLQNYAQIRNTCAEAGLQFRLIFDELRKNNPELTDASFLPFAYRFLLGRESNPATGIVWVFDTRWDSLCSESRSLIGSLIEKLSSEIAAGLPDRHALEGPVAGSLPSSLLRDTAAVGSMGASFIGLYALLEHPGRSISSDFYDAYNTALNYNKILVADTLRLYEETESFNAEKGNIEKLSSPSIQGLSTNQGLVSYSNSLISYSQRKFSGAQSAHEREVFLRNTHRGLPLASGEADAPNIPWESLYKALEKELSLFVSEQKAEGIRAWESLSAFVARSSNILKERYGSLYEEYGILLNDDKESSAPSYPDKALESFTKLKADLTQDLSALAVRFSWLDGAPDIPVRKEPGSPLFAEYYARIASDTAFLKSLSLSIDERNKTAQKNILAARQAKNEADFRYEQARTALQRENFNASREALQSARIKYNEFLRYQEDAVVRRETDAKLDALGLEIVRLENRKVVQDVRLLITEARSLYYTGDFELAERLIIQAEGRWAVTNVEPNVEVTNLKVMIGNALSIRTGRSIPVTDPLYPEMSQTLNAAYQYFEQGRALLKSGKRAEGLEVLNAAREKIKDIQVLYPLNQEANILTLRTAQLADPAGFGELFRQRYNNALRDYRNLATVNRAYADLKDLYEINPSYPGLKKRIYDIEVELGIIVPPPTPQQLARSKQLVREAARLFESSSRNELALNSALTKLDEALSLNPQNTEATVLIDRIKTGMGGQSLVVLTADKELLYQQAVQELAKGNTITAAALVADLWKDPKLRNSAKVIDLKRKVDSLL
ncbi:hypothetical protein V1L52_09260 [Treponema sp. HNW]|uniref:hypothetical protein n=1 Tax=Treponema sp. HNW TaxID=3116654 RepID=UPI003D0EEE60